MFGLFRTQDFQHATLGTFKWVRGAWRGEISLHGAKPVPLIVDGTRKGPDEEALTHAVNLPRDLEAVAPQLQRAMFEHCEPYAEAAREGELIGGQGEFPQVRSGADALRLAELVAVMVVEMDGALATEVCYRVPWDEEHTLGARFRGAEWVELCGSTAVP